MTDTTDVRFWDVRRNKSSRSTSYEVRWVVGGRQFSKTRATKALAESFLSELRQAAKRGEAFDTSEGLPVSMRRAKHARSWFAFVLAYVDMKWPRAAATTRNSMTDALATVTAALVDDRPGQPELMLLRRALRSTRWCRRLARCRVRLRSLLRLAGSNGHRCRSRSWRSPVTSGWRLMR